MFCIQWQWTKAVAASYYIDLSRLCIGNLWEIYYVYNNSIKGFREKSPIINGQMDREITYALEKLILCSNYSAWGQKISWKNADVSKNSAEFSENIFVFRNYISKATSMPNFTSIGHYWGGGFTSSPHASNHLTYIKSLMLNRVKHRMK